MTLLANRRDDTQFMYLPELKFCLWTQILKQYVFKLQYWVGLSFFSIFDFMGNFE